MISLIAKLYLDIGFELCLAIIPYGVIIDRFFPYYKVTVA